MRDGDVAYFVARGRGTTYWTIDPATAEAVELAGTRLDRSAVDLALAQVERMGEDDLALQMTLQGDAYRTAFASLEQTLHGGGTRGVGTADAEGVPERPLRDVLIDVLDGLLDQGIAFEDGVNWIDVSFDPGQGVVRPSALSTDLYSGLGGVALVFERAYRSLGDRRYLEAAERCLRREHENWQRSPAARDRWIRSTPEGVGTRAGVVAGWLALGRHEEHGTYRGGSGTRDVADRSNHRKRPRLRRHRGKRRLHPPAPSTGQGGADLRARRGDLAARRSSRGFGEHDGLAWLEWHESATAAVRIRTRPGGHLTGAPRSRSVA